MSKALILFFAIVQFAAAEIPDVPPDSCSNGCTEKMQSIVNGFDQGVLPDQSPGVYSGSCFHNGPTLNPEHEHHGVVLLDQENGWRFSARFLYFGDGTEYADWDLDRARKELSRYWESYDPIKVGSNTARAEMFHSDGAPSVVYWMRQRADAGNLFLIFHQIGYSQSYCELRRH